jgi:hypothetical protein
MITDANSMHDSGGEWPGSGSRNLADFLQESRTNDDDELAYVIDVAARRGLVAIDSLDEFFRLIPRLAERPIVLDAAIDAVIQVRRRGGESKPALIVELKSRYPQHSEAIDIAAVLSSVVSGSVDGRVASSSSPRSLPEDIGPPTPDGMPRYCLRERIGAGSQGQVYLAVDRLMSREDAPTYVAVKFLRGQVVLQADQRLAGEEAIKARRIEHPCVARVIDRGVTSAGVAYVVFEHVDGGNVEHHVRRHGPMTEPDAARFIMDVARGIQTIHSAGLFHCDLKPSNVLRSRSGDPRITDFGLARWVGERGLAASSEEGAQGSIGFAAPEQFEGTFPLTAACDVYALGGLLLFCATGEVPNGETPEEARRNLSTRFGSGPLNTAVVQKVRDARLRAICARTLSRNPCERHVSAEAVAGDLDRWLRHEPIDWIQESRDVRLRRWLQREQKAVLAAGVALAAVAIAGVWTAHSYAASESSKALAGAAAMREAAESQRLKEIRGTIGEMRRTLVDARKERLEPDWLLQVTWFESMLGPHFFGPELVGVDHWRRRIDIAEQLSRESLTSDGSQTVTSLLWMFLAGVWSAGQGDHAKGAELLRSAADHWRSVAPKDMHILELNEKCWAACVVLCSRSDATVTPESLLRARAVLAGTDGPLVRQTGGVVSELLSLARTELNSAAPGGS